MQVLDSGIAKATPLRDTTSVISMLKEKAYRYIYVWKAYPKAIEALHQCIALRKNAEDYFSMGIAMGLQKNDSASYYMNRSVEFAIGRRPVLPEDTFATVGHHPPGGYAPHHAEPRATSSHIRHHQP